MQIGRRAFLKSQLGIFLFLSLIGFTMIQPVNASSQICKRAPIASVDTSIQTLYSGDSLTVTFRGVGGNCGTGNFKVIVSSSAETNSQGYLTGTTTNVTLNSNPSWAEDSYQRVTHTRQFSDSAAGRYFQYYFATTSGVKVRSGVVAVSSAVSGSDS